MSYDSAITTFSPSGNLLQVEYAMEAVKEGQLTAALKTKEGIVMAVQRRTYKKLQDNRSQQKIQEIDSHICTAFAGLQADARILINTARLHCQSYKLNWEDAPSVDYMTKYISGTMQKYTQKGGSRPFGLSIFIAGLSREGQPQLYQVDPSGMTTAWKANAIGKSSSSLTDYFQKHYKEDMSLQEGLMMMMRPVFEVVEKPRKNVQFSILTAQGTRMLTDEEMDRLVKAVEQEVKEN
jgi:20S proteasome alpha/beta subunit